MPLTQTTPLSSHPRVGMLATVRNRRGMISAVEPYDTGEGRLHLVRVEYTDSDGAPEDTLLWEREFQATLLEPTALPRLADTPAMIGSEFDALQRAARWSALSPYHLPESERPQQGATPIASPLFGAVQAEDFQLVPLLKALKMPRISLLLADDVGLGKTIEAGLILTELLLRRRIRRVLILSPASLRTQWKSEMQEKFSLGFEVIDRAETHALQKRLGLDANPWRTYPRIITSYYYLRQPDVLEQFRAACKQPENSVQLPWDLLIVDEAHNLMPASFGEDSDLCKMLRTISPWFEHKLFLTATPHNGHTRSFSGLLELLDPVRFTQTSEFNALTTLHTIPARLPTTADTSGEMPVNEAEARLLAMLQRAGFPTPQAQKEIDLGRPLGRTIPDFFYTDPNDQFEGICIYLDGLSTHIHGNRQAQTRDRQLREELSAREFKVIEIAATELTDRETMVGHFYDLRKVLVGRARAREMRENGSGF